MIKVSDSLLVVFEFSIDTTAIVVGEYIVGIE
jgi:hypothetical protein